MNWLFPGFMAGTLLLGVPIALHFLRSKPKVTVPFPSLRFLGPTDLRETKRNELRRWLTLLLRCLVIGLLALAFARPFFPSSEDTGGHAVVLAIDNSMSMQSEDRWQALQSWALEKLSTLSSGDRVGVLLMNPTPTWLLPLGEKADPERARLLLRDFKPGYETTRYEPALRLAAASLAETPCRQRSLLWMADGQRVGWTGVQFKDPLPPGVAPIFPPPSTMPVRQAAIHQARLETRGAQSYVRLAVRLFQPENEERTLRIHSGSTLLLEKTIRLEGSGPQELEYALPPGPADGRPLRLSFEPADSLPADDTYYLGFSPSNRQGVLVDKASGVDFLGHALHASRNLALGSGEARILPEDDTPWPPGSLAILRTGHFFQKNKLPQVERFLAGGGNVWVLLDGSAEQLEWLKTKGVTATSLPALSETFAGTAPALHTLENWDPEHPLLKPFADDSLLPLMELEFSRGWGLRAEKSERIVSWENGLPAMLELHAGAGRILVCGFSFDQNSSNWVKHPSFLPIIHQGVRLFSSNLHHKLEWRVGETIPLPEPGRWKQVEGPQSVEEIGVQASVPASIPGIYQFVPSDPQKTACYYTVNVPPEESDLSPWPDPAAFELLDQHASPAKKNGQAQAARLLGDETSESRQRLWWWLLMAAFLFLLAEVCLANRSTP